MTEKVRTRLRDRIVIDVGRVAFGVGILVVWQYSHQLFGANPFWFSKPSAVFATALALFHNGSLMSDLEVTLAETIAGFAAGCIVGVPVGIILGKSRFLQELFEPFLLVINALPKIALAPLLLVWFGIGFGLKVAIAFSLVVVVMILSVYLGMRTLRQELIHSCRVMGATEFQLMTKVVLPSILPWILSGIKLSLSFSLIGAILGEFIAARQGIGYMMDSAMGTFNTPTVFVGLLLLLALSWVINAAIDWLSRLLGFDANSSVMSVS